MVAALLRYGGGFYVRAADEKKAIPPEKLQQYIIEYYNKEAKPLGEKAKRYLKDYLTELQTALEYYRKVGLVIGERPFEVALGFGDYKLYNERLEDATDNYYQQMSRLTSKTNQRFDIDYKNLSKTQKQQKAAQRGPFETLRQERRLVEQALKQLNETDNEVRTVTESLYQSIITAIQNQVKATEWLMERTKTEPFLLMLTRYNKGQDSWMAVANNFRFSVLGKLFEEVDELQEEAEKRFEKAKLRAEISRELPQEQLGKEAMTAPKQLNYKGRVYHLVEAAETKPKFEGFPEIPMGKALSDEFLLEKAKAIRDISRQLNPVGASQTTGEVTYALASIKRQLGQLMKAYETLADFEEFFPKKLNLLGNPQHAEGVYEEAAAKIDAVLGAVEIWGKNMGKWARDLDEMVKKRGLEKTRRPDPTDDPSKMKAPPQTVRF